MKEDLALTLKRTYDKGASLPLKDVQAMLEESELVKKLLEPPKQRPETFVGIRAYEWRFLELSEIPFTNTLETVQSWI